jgi:uncharacterized protein (TIGR01777 family)
LLPALRGCQGIVHLAGEPVFGGRWGKRKRDAIYDSRIVTTRAVVQAIHDLSPRPEVLVCASAVGFYGMRPPDEVVDEDTVDAARFAPGDFLAWVCRDWEIAAEAAERYGVRTVRARIGVVLAPGHGMLARMEKPFRMGLGGKVGRGDQVISWIHVDDVSGLLVAALERPEISEALNVVAPHPVSNAAFSQALARALGKPCVLRVPRALLRLQMGKAAVVVATGQNVVPTRAMEYGYRFAHPTVEEALASIYRPAAPAPRAAVPV